MEETIDERKLNGEIWCGINELLDLRERKEVEKRKKILEEGFRGR